MNNSKFLTVGFLFLFIAGILPAQAGTKTWKAATTGDWFAIASWVEADYPRAGDLVVITNAGASVLLTNSTEYLSSFVISNTASLVFSNWNTTLSATNVYLRTNATLTLPSAFTDVQMSNNVYIVCSNLTIDAGGKIDADGKGYSGGKVSYVRGFGPGGTNGAGSYGGLGGGGVLTYGLAATPLDPGSGGFCGDGTYAPGGHGGGAICIQASGTLTVNGLITATGVNALGNYGSYPGSGGGIYIICNTLAGNGVVSANGGMQMFYGHNGGGGRIAVLYTNLAAQVPTVRFSAAGGLRGTGYDAAPVCDIGTLYFPDARILTEVIQHSGQLMIPGFTNWSPNTLMVSNGWIRFPVDGFRLAVTNDVTVWGSAARLELGGNRKLIKTSGYNSDNIYNSRFAWFTYSETNGPTLTCGGNLVLTNGGSLYIYSGLTNATAPTYGALVRVTNDVIVAGSNSWIYPYSHPTNGGSVLFQMRNLTILTNSGFNADYIGYMTGLARPAFGYGPGATNSYAGTYGGVGYYNTVSTYGSPSAPIDPGSGGYNGADYIQATGGNGGGLVRIEAGGTARVDGVISANGEYAQGVYNSWPGSGGGIYIVCNTITGSTGIIRANGGPAETGNGAYGGGGGGGGGRIAIIYTNAAAQQAAGVPGITFSAAGGTGYGTRIGDLGTLYFPDTLMLAPFCPHSGQLVIPGLTTWAPASLTLSNGWIRFPADGFLLAVSNNVTIDGSSARLELGGRAGIFDDARNRFIYSPTNGSTLTCGGNLVLTNSGRLYVYAGPTNSSTPNYGALVSVAGLMKLETNCWVYPYSNPTNGGSTLFRVRDLICTTNAGFNADASGFIRGLALHTPGYGPGGGNQAGCYGGLGGGATSGTYGSSNAPVDPGSGGYTGDFVPQPGGNGGGFVRILASGSVLLNGTMTANGGGAGNAVYNPRSGSGGGIYIYGKRFSTTVGSTAILSANGGSGGVAGGGGGRIAIWRMTDSSVAPLTATVAGGTGTANGSPGTIVWGWIPAPGTVFVVH